MLEAGGWRLEAGERFRDPVMLAAVNHRTEMGNFIEQCLSDKENMDICFYMA